MANCTRQPLVNLEVIGLDNMAEPRNAGGKGPGGEGHQGGPQGGGGQRGSGPQLKQFYFIFIEV